MLPCPHPCRSAPTATRPSCAASWRSPTRSTACRAREAARLAGTTGQTLGDWVHRNNTEGIEGLRDRPRPGRPCALDEGQQAALKALVLRGPDLARDGC